MGAAFLLAFLPSPPAHASSIEGRWLLVEQYYGSGRSNLASMEVPVHLEISRHGERAVGRIWAGDDAARAYPWPSWIADRGPLAPRDVEIELSAEGDRVQARYWIDPSPDDDLALEVIEEYRAGEDGSTLSGSLAVTFHRGGGTRGSYVLQRRFQREW